MILYHGSSVAVDKPLVQVGCPALDFGPGFYLTRLKEQAERWARRVCVVRHSAHPVLSIYEWDEKAFVKNSFRHLCLPDYNQVWLDFIVASRRGEQPWKDYDVVEGGVANDQVIDTVEDYYVGRITAEQALGQLQFARPTHQMCINRQAAIDHCLLFAGIEEVKI